MKTFLDLFLILHFIGLAALLGGVLSQMAAPVKKVVSGMFHGALTMLVTGIAMMGLAEAVKDEDITGLQMKFGVKILILAVILALVMQGRKKESIDNATFFSIGALSVANIAIAVLWQLS